MATRKPTAKSPARKRSASPRRKAAAPKRRAPSSNRLVFHEVDEARWPDFARLFESRGILRACWCMAWRASSAEAQRMDGAARRSAMEQRVREGTPVGILGYLDGEPVAWCSIAPRETYRKELGGTDTDAPGTVWSLACFFVSPQVRGQGVTRQLIDAAIAHARARGARSIEASPVDPDSPSYRYMGFVGTFEAMGFRELGRAGSRRHLMRYDLE